MSIPGSSSALFLAAAAAGAGGYQVQRSLRFNSSDSAYLSRTPASAGNRKTWTWAGWVKRGSLGSRQMIFGNLDSGATLGFNVEFTANDLLDIYDYSSGFEARRATTQVFRDCSAWYHIVIVYDSTNAIAADRLRLYVNGARVTAFANSTDPTLNADGRFNTAVQTSIGRTGAYDLLYFSGYLAEIHFIDGQALTPSSFAETDATTGQWIPKLYSGSYGTNGFKLTFSDNSAATAAALGKDAAGSNNWTPNNFSVTAGAGNDSLVDTPSSAGTDSGLGGQVTGNYATLNPLDTGTVALSNGNLQATYSNTAYSSTRSTVGLSSGKWYWEVTVDSSVVANSIGTAARPIVGIMKAGASLSNYVGADSNGWGYIFDGLKITNGSSSSYGSSFTGGDVIGVALDLDAGTLTFYKNNVSQGQAYSSLSGTFFPATTGGKFSSGNTDVIFHFNAGQRAFAYAAPANHKALCDTNLTAPVIAKPSMVMDVKLYTGNGSTQTISGLGFSPDLVWVKNRASSTYWHVLFDEVRGAGNQLSTNVTDAELASGSNFAGKVSAFTSDGFTVAAGSNNINSVGQNNVAYVAWTWDAGSSTVPNTQGSITSTVRANPSAGFSIVSWTPQASAGTVGHGLNVAPEFIITKDRATANGWFTYHKSLGIQNYLVLNLTNAVTSNATVFSTAPTSTVFNQGSGFTSTNGYGNQICYCFAPVAGYSSFGSYTGNGSADGPFVYTGFRPRWILFKCSSAVAYWGIYDAVRNTYNAVNLGLYPNDSIAEISDQPFDFLSNGFKVRGTTAFVNSNAATYVWAAFAESPFAYSRAR